MAFYDPRTALPLLALFGIQVWSSAAYDTWEGGASFGARRLITTLPALLVGWAYLAQGAIVLGKRHARNALWVGVAVGVLWNVGLIIQYSTGMISRNEAVTREMILHNQLHVVPFEAPKLLWGYLTDRSQFYTEP